jgi:hypothetical protein
MMAIDVAMPIDLAVRRVRMMTVLRRQRLTLPLCD